MNLSLLKSRMSELNMNTAQLIRMSNVSESTIKRILRGKTDVHTSTLRMIASAVDLDPARLLDEDVEVPVSFDPANVPEIAAEVLEEMTQIEANESHGVTNAPLACYMNPEGVKNEPLNTPVVSPECEVFYERMIKYLRERLDASYAANEQIRLQNTELVKSNARLLEQEAVTRQRNRALYTGIIIAVAVAGLCLAGLVAYFVYDIVSPTWGMVRY